MNSRTPTSSNYVQYPVPLNKGFLQLAEVFNENGWKLVENNDTGIIYVNPVNMCDEFKIMTTNTSIQVVIPMPNSNIAYCTKFQNYFDASEYVIARLEDYMASSHKKSD